MNLSTILLAILLANPADNPKESRPPATPPVVTPGTQFGSTEERILAGLNLAPEQRTQLKKAEHITLARYKELREQYEKDGDLWAYVRGQKAAADWSRAETKRVLTKEQHDQYIDQWYQAMAPYLENSRRIEGSRRRLPMGAVPPSDKPKSKPGRP